MPQQLQQDDINRISQLIVSIKKAAENKKTHICCQSASMFFCASATTQTLRCIATQNPFDTVCGIIQFIPFAVAIKAQILYQMTLNTHHQHPSYRTVESFINSQLPIQSFQPLLRAAIIYGRKDDTNNHTEENENNELTLAEKNMFVTDCIPLLKKYKQHLESQRAMESTAPPVLQMC